MAQTLNLTYIHMKNNRLFIAMPSMAEALMDDLRKKLEIDYTLFDRHGNADVAIREKHYGFSTVAPNKTDSKFRCFRRMLGCSFIYMPCGWQADKCSRKAFAWAEFLCKKVIFEEDGRCR